MSEYNEGDLVEAVKDDAVIRGRLRDIPGNSGRPQLSLTLALTTDLLHLAANGFTITVIDRATPPLPTEPGWYEAAQRSLAAGFAPYELRDGEWECTGRRLAATDDLRGVGPFTRLEPVPVTAKRVAEDFVAAILTKHDERMGNTYSLHASTLMEIAAEFGVES